MGFHLWTNFSHIGSQHIRNNRHCMWIPHIHHINRQLLSTRQIDVIQIFRFFCHKWNFLRQEFWITHIHSHPAIGTEFRFHDSSFGLYLDFGFSGQLTLMHETGKTAYTIAALLNLRTICIKNTVFKICTWNIRRFNNQELVKTHTKVTICQALNSESIQISTLANQVYHHKIIAQAMHLGKFKQHYSVSLRQ